MYGNMKKPNFYAKTPKNQLKKIKKDDIDKFIKSLDLDATRRVMKRGRRRASPKKY